MRHTYLFTFYLNKIKCKKPKVNTEPTHFPILMNNGMACSYQCSDQFQFLPEHWPAKRYWISLDLKKTNLFKNNLNNTRNNMKSQIQNKKNGGIVELLTPTLNKIISRSSHQRCSLRKGVLRNFAKFTGKHLCRSLFLIKLPACNFITEVTLAQVFSREFCKISKNTFLTEHL